MDSFLQLGGFQLPFQRRLSRLYNDTKKSSDFLKEPVQNAEDPDLKALHRKLRIQKDRLVSWGLEWSDPDQSAEIDESLSKAGLSEIVGSIMSTIKDTLAEAEPLWLSSKRPLGGEKSEKGSGDWKAPLVVWDKSRFEDLLRDLTTSIDTLYDLSRTRSSAAMSSQAARSRMLKSSDSQSFRAFESTRMQAPQHIDPSTLTNLRSMQPEPMTESDSRLRSRDVAFMTKQAYSDLTKGSDPQPWAPLLLEYATFDAIYSTTGIMPPMARFEKLSAGLQQEPQRSPGAWTGLPRLLGYFEDLEHSRLGLVYRFPPSFNAISHEHLTRNPLYNLCTLGDLLSRPDFEPRLEAKFRLAYNLANTVFDMHARGITHGNLIDANVSFCNAVGTEPGQASGEVDIRRPLISSFDVFPDTPSEDFSSEPLHLYRHPLDPRTISSTPLSLKSDSRVLDLYSLAMVLLSIGLWSKLDLLAPSPESPAISESVLEQLAIRCGSLYMKAVQTCWNAVDQELSGKLVGDELLSNVQVKASRYLEACCILDGVSGLEERIGGDLREESPTPSVPQVSTTAAAAAAAGSSQAVERVASDIKRVSPAVAGSFSPVVHSEKLEVMAPVEGRTFPQHAQPLIHLLMAMTDITADSIERHEGNKLEGNKLEGNKLRLYPQIPLSPEAVEKWNTIVMPQINHALRHFYRRHPESVEISLESIGVSPQKTQPTVLVVCTSVGKVRAILKRKVGDLFEGATGFGLKVCRGQVLRSRKHPQDPRRSMAGPDISDAPNEEIDDVAAANPDYQERPNNGASIGAWIGDRHLPPVSFGGLVIVDEKTYGMTVHHMLDDPEAPGLVSSQDAQRCAAGVDNKRNQTFYEESLGDSSGTEDFACEFSDSDAYLETDITSDYDDESDYEEEEEDDDEDSEFNEPGDIPGIEPGCGEGYIVTQPALDDIEEGTYASPETENKDHLNKCSLGEVYASSGIRRRRKSGLVHEIDWALFEFKSNRLPDDNTIPRLGKAEAHLAGEGGILHPTTIASGSSLPGRAVQCVARTSGLQTGLILPALTSVKIFGRASPSHTYQVSSAATIEDEGRRRTPLGIPGDSGAWIVDRVEGKLCGHVLAWSQRKQVAYICPMDVLLLDIAKTLEATEVRLPGGEAFVTLRDLKVAEDRDEGVDDVGDEDLTDLLEDDEMEVDNEPPLLVDSALEKNIGTKSVAKGKILVEEMEKLRAGKSIGVRS
jgi:hypothetical protein